MLFLGTFLRSLMFFSLCFASSVGFCFFFQVHAVFHIFWRICDFFLIFILLFTFFLQVCAVLYSHLYTVYVCTILSWQVYAASCLPHTPLSRYIESRVRQRLSQLESEEAAATLSIRLISNVEVTFFFYLLRRV